MVSVYKNTATTAYQYLFKFLEQTDVAVTALTACIILYTRSAGVLYFAAGAVVCSRTVKLLKLVLRQPRPLHPTPGSQKQSYGMPSTHSSVITYYAAYALLACVYLPIHSSMPNSIFMRVIPPFIFIPWAITVAISRIWLGHHTWEQVAVGCTHGLFFTPFWFMLWTHGGNEYGRMLEQTYLVW